MLNILLTSVEDVVIIYWNEVYVAVIQSRYLLDVQAASVVMFTQASISQCTVLQLYSTVLALYWDASCNHCCSLQWPKNFAVVWNTHRSSMDCLSNNSNQHPWIAFAHVQLRLELQAVADSCNRSTASTNCAGGSASEVSTKEAFQATTWTRFPEPNFSSPTDGHRLEVQLGKSGNTPQLRLKSFPLQLEITTLW